MKYNNHGCTRRAKNPQHIAENLLNRQFHADKPNEKWLTDVTEFKWYEGITVAQTSNQRPQTPLFASVYSGARYSQTSSNTQRELMLPDEILRLDRRQCIVLFQGRKPALLYKLAPEEFPDYGTLKSCRVADYTPEWRLKEEQPQVSKKEHPAPPKAEAEQKSRQEPEQEPSDSMDEPNPTRNLEYQFNSGDNSLGMVELGPAGVVGGEDEDEENPPGR